MEQTNWITVTPAFYLYSHNEITSSQGEETGSFITKQEFKNFLNINL